MAMTSDSERQRRLLDLLAGWEQYVQSTLDGEVWRGNFQRAAIEEEGKAISDLYQRIGAIEDFSTWEYAEAMREIANIVRTGGTSYG